MTQESPYRGQGSAAVGLCLLLTVNSACQSLRPMEQVGALLASGIIPGDCVQSELCSWEWGTVILRASFLHPFAHSKMTTEQVNTVWPH